MRRIAFILILTGVALGAWLAFGHRPDQPVGQDLRSLLPAIDQGQGAVAARAAAAIKADWEGNLPTLLEMISSSDWRRRSKACQALSWSDNPLALPLILPRASDSDWRVRAAAFDALWRMHDPALPQPMKDTPLDQRERLLLAWLASYEQAGKSPPAGNLCDLYDNAGHVEFGRPLASRCLSCHAGESPTAFEDNSKCAACHAEIYADWSFSAHARSLSHLKLTTVDPVDRTPRAMSFMPVQGIGCLECHRLDASAPPAATSSSGVAAHCPFVFSAQEPARESCRRCHAGTFQQWQNWQSTPHPRQLDWPPGQIDMQSLGDVRTCVDCHMPRTLAGENQTWPSHAWAARRSPALLQQGVKVSLSEPSAGQPEAELTITNLAGHNYPTGSRRRAVRLTLESLPAQRDRMSAATGPSPDESIAPPARNDILASFSADPLGLTLPGSQPALRPGESRKLRFLPPPGPIDLLLYRLTYLRNAADPAAYSAEVSGSLETPGQGR